MPPIHYKIRGEGQAVILIHGFCETSDIWSPFIGELSSEFQVICVDLPGFGKSPLSNFDISIEEIGKAMNAWVLKSKFENPIIIGHSLGGYVCLSMMAEKPALYAGLGLIHSSSRADSEIKRNNRTKVMEFVKSNGVGVFVDSFIPDLYRKKDHASIEYALRIAQETPESTFMAYTGAMRNRPSREDVLSNLRVPALIIAGQNDPVIDVNSLKEQAKLSDRIRFYILPEVGHMGMLEARKETASLVNTFVAEIKSALKA